jgi:hypothetical protein
MGIEMGQDCDSRLKGCDVKSLTAQLWNYNDGYSRGLI